MLKYTIMRGEATPFVMELPVYHVPHVKSLIIQTWQRLKGFVLRAGKVIIIVSIFLSAFNSFSLSGKIVDNINDSALASVSRVITPVFNRLACMKITGRQRLVCLQAQWRKKWWWVRSTPSTPQKIFRTKSSIRRNLTSVKSCSVR